MHFYELGYNPSDRTLTIALPFPLWEQIIIAIVPLPPIFCEIEPQKSMPKLELNGNRFGFGPELRVSRSEVGITLAVQIGKNVSARTVASIWATIWIADYLTNDWPNFLPPSIAIEVEPDSCRIRAKIAPELAVWLPSFNLGTIPDLMKEVQVGIIGRSADIADRIAEVRGNGALNLSCNSNCCCMAAGHQASPRNGYTLSSHNCDCTSDLLAFMCALAYIEHGFRQELMVSKR
ncbi:MAG: hypothetical protein WCG48_03420 [Candidatus Berkelbacteria bacterium]